MNLDPEHFYTVATKNELDDLLEGKDPGNSAALGEATIQQVTSGLTGVIWVRRRRNENVQPLALVVSKEDQRRLFGRYAILRSDLSPLTAWCHILTPQRFECLDSLDWDPEFGGLEAAWTGLAIAEARLLTKRPTNNIRISACLATNSFAVARAAALWSHHAPPLDVAEKCDAVRQLVRPLDREDRWGDRLKSALVPIWNSLNGLAAQSSGCAPSEINPIVSSLRALLSARLNNDPTEARLFVAPLLSEVPELKLFDSLPNLTPEERLRLFDQLVDQLSHVNSQRERVRHLALPLVAGYLATVAAGGKSSLNMAEKLAPRWPEITAWAYAIGGLGEKVTWTASFDGLGRLVARELTRPLHLDEPPNYDIALEEALILVDRKLSDPLVHLRIKQARILTVSILPGVNVLVSGRESWEIEKADPISAAKHDWSSQQKDDHPRVNPMPALADALWPHIHTRLEKVLKDHSLQEKPRPQNPKKRGADTKKKQKSQKKLYRS